MKIQDKSWRPVRKRSDSSRRFLLLLKLGKLSDKVPEPTCIDSVTSFNEMAVELRKGQSWEQVWYRFKLGGEILSLSYSDLPDDLWEKKIWADELMTPEALFLIEIKHYRKHFIEIEEVLRKL